MKMVLLIGNQVVTLTSVHDIQHEKHYWLAHFQKQVSGTHMKVQGLPWWWN